MTEIREYRASDADSWLRCRLLSFFGTEYYDDIVVHRPTFIRPVHQLVAVDNDTVVGLMDVEVLDAGLVPPEGVDRVMSAFMQAPISAEAVMRERCSRVHVCRQYVRSL